MFPTLDSCLLISSGVSSSMSADGYQSVSGSVSSPHTGRKYHRYQKKCGRKYEKQTKFPTKVIRKIKASRFNKNTIFF